jgi:radical SAM-linked protein
MNDPLNRQRIRFIYEKGDRIKFISHQDEFRLWERTLRRADLPLLYKQGFNPQPHIQFAAPLALGMTGTQEIIDVIFSPPRPVEEIRERVQAKLPPGTCLHSLHEVPVKATAPQALVIGADCTILLYAEPGEIPDGLIQERIEGFLASAEAWRRRERHGQPYQYNLRPLVLELRYEGYDPQAEEHRIFVRVQMRPGATGRPDELVDVLGFDDFARTLRRDRLYLEGNPENETVMGQYRIIPQEEVTPEPPQKARRGRKGKRKDKQAKPKPDAPTQERGLQSFAEKAGDEFA